MKERLNVLLVKPYKVTDEIQPPLGLGYLATAVRKEHDVEILDGIREKMTLDKFESLLENKRYDVVGFQCYTFDVPEVRSMIGAVKRILPETKTIVGGIQPSCDPENIIDHVSADFGFIGEAEKGFPLFLKKLSERKTDSQELKDVPGLVWKDEKGINKNAPFFVENLDELGSPSWDLLKPNEYPNAPHGAFYKQQPVCPIMTTRGCPFSCTYCAGFRVSGRKIRYHSVEHVLNEIELLHNKYGINEVHIEDDNFTFKREFVVEFCNGLMEKGLNISWTCPNGVRLDTLDEELLRIMKKAGMYSISVGVESGSQRILQSMKKNLTKEKIEEKVALARKVGLEVIGFFIVGFPGETEEDIIKTIKFAKKLDLKRANFMAYKPFPGTESYNELIKAGEIKEWKWSNFSLSKIAFAPKGISQKQLKNLRRRAFIEFYLRPKIILKMVKEIKSPAHLKFISQRMFRWLVK